MQHEHPHDDGESGAALVLAIAFVFVFSIILTGVLGLTDASLQTGQRVAGQRDLVYSADSALQAAINHVRHDPALAVDGTAAGGSRACWPAAAPFVAPTTNGVTVEVTCEAATDSGVDLGVGATPSSAPGQAILMLGGGDALVQASNNELLVGGHVHVHGNVTASASSAHLTVTRGDLRASGTCPPGKVSAAEGTVVCGPTASPVPDPAYPLLAADGTPLTAPPPRRAVPACTASVVTFQPGWYDDATALSACTGNRVLHFTPGVYYFDFQASTAKEWLVDNSGLTIIGGTSAAPTPSRAAGCLTQPAAPAGTPGVQFVFGGESRLNVTSGHVDLCPTVTSDRQQISIYGVRNSVTPAAVTTLQLAATAANQAGSGFTSPANGAVVDGAFASAALLERRSTATLRVSNFAPALSIPDGSTIDSVRLRVTHDETQHVNKVAVQVTSAGGTSGEYELSRASTVHTDTVDITAWVGNDPERLRDLRVDYTATAANNTNARSARLDGITLEVTYTPPMLRATSGCAAAGTSCPIVRIDGAQSSLSTAGTVYVPRGHVDVNMSNAGGPVFNRGITARSAVLSITPSSTASGPFPLVSTPTWGPGGISDRTATFTARCVSTASATDQCPASPVLARADVTFAHPTTAVTIDRWRVSSGGLSE